MHNCKKLCMVSLGSYLMGIGVALATASTFGADSVALLWEGMSKTCSFSIGTANLVFSGILLAIVLLLDRRQIYVGTLLSPLIEGIAIDMVLPYLPQIHGVLLQFFVMVVGILILCIGTGLYAYADYGRGPYIALTFIVKEKTKWNLTWIRTILDLTCLILGVVMGAHISIGPVASVILCGYCTNKTIQVLSATNKSSKQVYE